MELINKSKIFLGLSLNYFIDYVVFVKESALFRKNTEEKKLAYITFLYHSLEKGFSMPNMRFKFGKDKVSELIRVIEDYIAGGNNLGRSQFIAGVTVLTRYYGKHEEAGIDLDFFSRDKYLLLTEIADKHYNGVVTIKKEEFNLRDFSYFNDFVKSRRSVRIFSNRIIEDSTMKEVVNLANYCPSACNRQSSKVYFVKDKALVDKILLIQRGILTTMEDVHQILVVTASRNYFLTSGERNQLYVDGGIFLESLLLSLHSKNIAACPLHWSLNRWHDQKIKGLINLSDGEKVISLIAVGYLKEDVKVPGSQRKSVEELITIVY